ncbi:MULTISPECIES: 7-carboxy-7-deazaguanine synthase QueE [Gammaproteobacteria]|uniref:7-carboxy-7-deazaguanine synthase QueE n=1 Tax=Gammaproteobacteria TaxID=1236 RepID=UPI000DCFB3D1|nr:MULTISPECIES: 7-carboxy-7-deazaguanine synthase QueE [Gammaproteobacteria]RTE87410.1 7-carboxy-7-deazaguanine synthase QueE [Aliidiomarina sp. B3213]TCZ92804.1 7-carboxy-7-deazaguanine synthase QueE [Lysobacter sp. N42]
MKIAPAPQIQTTLPVNEAFETIQGEGVYTGVPAIFLRLQGCPIGCPWCDTQHTWPMEQTDKIEIKDVLAKKKESSQWASQTPAQILEQFQQQGWTAKHVVITGGEPCMFDLTELTTTLHKAGYQCQIETSGTFEVRVHPDTWVTVSPKVDMPGGYAICAQAMQRANEIKYPIAMQKHVDALDELLKEHPVDPTVSIALQPISQRPRATELAIETCIKRNWRLSVQLHKYLAID